MTRVLLLALLLLVAPAAPQTAPSDLDAWVLRAMTAFEVSGLSLAVVKDGQIVVAKGYGVRRLGAAGAVNARTRGPQASNVVAAAGRPDRPPDLRRQELADRPSVDHAPEQGPRGRLHSAEVEGQAAR